MKQHLEDLETAKLVSADSVAQSLHVVSLVPQSHEKQPFELGLAHLRDAVWPTTRSGPRHTAGTVPPAPPTHLLHFWPVYNVERALVITRRGSTVASVEF